MDTQGDEGVRLSVVSRCLTRSMDEFYTRRPIERIWQHQLQHLKLVKSLVRRMEHMSNGQYSASFVVVRGLILVGLISIKT